MSLIDKSIKLQFIKNDSESYEAALTQAIYSIIKTIFEDSFIDENDSTIYFNQEKKDGIKFSAQDTRMLSLTFIINGNSYNRKVHYSNDVNYIFSKNIIYYNINIEKMNFAFSFVEGYLNYCIGYQKEIGFYLCGFFGGWMSNTQGYPEIFLSNYNFYKFGVTNESASYNKWVSDSIFPFITLQQVPLFISQGNFNNLYELTGVYDDLILNKYHIIQSNNKNYRVLSTYDFGLKGAGWSMPVLAMEVTDD